MVVLAFLSDPEVVGKILKHLGLPTVAPAVAPARSTAPALGFALPEEGEDSGSEEGDGGKDPEGVSLPTRPPP